MGPDQLAGVMQTIGRQAAEKSVCVPMRQTMSAYMVKEADKQSDPWYASGPVWDDGVVFDPRETEEII